MSIPANIVEGSGQESWKDFGRFLRYAANSATKLEYHLMIARDCRVISLNDFAALADRSQLVLPLRLVAQVQRRESRT